MLSERTEYVWYIPGWQELGATGPLSCCESSGWQTYLLSRAAHPMTVEADHLQKLDKLDMPIQSDTVHHAD